MPRVLALSIPVLVACGSTSGSGFDTTVDAGSGAASNDDAGSAIGDGGSQGKLTGDASSDAGTGDIDPKTPVDVIATADNAYGFGWGDANSLTTYIANPPSVTAGDIFNCPVGGPARKGAALASGATVGPEAYEVPADQAPPGAFLYLIAWADFSTTQGVIAQFKRQGGTTVYTGAGEWQACATGLPYDTSGATATGPTQTVINQQVTICNAGTGDKSTSSGGWVGPTGPISTTPGAVGTVVFGQDNSDTTDMRGSGHDFPPTCGEPSWKDPDNGGIDPAAKWMWYQPPGGTGDAFQATGSNTTRTFLIFRLPAKAVPGAPR
ncbi:MAG TPA: hypothetical protein VF407_21780 [Polyangiaceae bacterium]